MSTSKPSINYCRHILAETEYLLGASAGVARERRKMAGTRDRLIHDYLGVDYELVWDIVMNKVPALKKAMAEIVDKEEPV